MRHFHSSLRVTNCHFASHHFSDASLHITSNHYNCRDYSRCHYAVLTVTTQHYALRHFLSLQLLASLLFTACCITRRVVTSCHFLYTVRHDVTTTHLITSKQLNSTSMSVTTSSHLDKIHYSTLHLNPLLHTTSHFICAHFTSLLVVSSLFMPSSKITLSPVTIRDYTSLHVSLAVSCDTPRPQSNAPRRLRGKGVSA